MKGGDPMENKEYEYDRYEVKLNRFMNVQKDYWFCLLGLVVCALVAAISILVYKEEIQYLALLAVIYLIAVVLKLCSNPRRLEITRTTVNFQYRYALLTLFVHG
jgi:hypothetical protein